MLTESNRADRICDLTFLCTVSALKRTEAQSSPSSTHPMPAPLPDNESQRLAALHRYHILDTPPEQAFDDFVRLASVICQAPVAVLTFLDRDRQWFKASIGAGAKETSREHAFCSHTIVHKGIMIVEDVLRDARFADNPYAQANPGPRFYAGAPLIDNAGMALGAICVLDRQPRQITSEQARALEALARQIIVLLEFRRVSAELADALEQVKTLRGLIPICSHCKGVRDDAGFWQSVETYISDHSDADFSHGICPDCIKAQYPELYADMRAAGKL